MREDSEPAPSTKTLIIEPGSTKTLIIEPGIFSVCRMSPIEPVPNWVDRDSFHSVTRTGSELSIVCVQECVPPGVRSQSGWKAFRFSGTLDFSLTGVLLSIASPLAKAGVSIFAISTFDTDYVLVSEEDFEQAKDCLEMSGFDIRPN